MYLSRAASKRAVKLEEVEVALVIEDMEMRATMVRSCGQKVVEGKEGNFSGRVLVQSGVHRGGAVLGLRRLPNLCDCGKSNTA